MNHADAQTLLDAYLDDELDVATSQAIEAHVRDCAECTQWLAARRKVVDRIRSAKLRYRELPSLQERVRAQWSPQHRKNFIAAWPASLAAGIVLAIGGFLLGHFSRSPNVNEEFVTAHVRSTLSANAVEVQSSDHHTVKPWLSAKLPFSPPVPELKESGDALLGGRVDYLEHTRVAALVYQHGNHVVNVFIWPRDANMPVAKDGSMDGYHWLTTTAGAFDAVIVSDMSNDEMNNFRQRWSTAAGGS